MKLVIDPGTTLSLCFGDGHEDPGVRCDHMSITLQEDGRIIIKYNKDWRDHDSKFETVFDSDTDAEPSLKVHPIPILDMGKAVLLMPETAVESPAFVWLKKLIANILKMDNIDEALPTTSFIDDLGFDQSHWEDLEQECVERYGEEFVDLQAWPTEYKTLQDLLNSIEHLQPIEEDDEDLDDDSDEDDEDLDDDSDEDDPGPELVEDEVVKGMSWDRAKIDAALREIFTGYEKLTAEAIDDPEKFSDATWSLNIVESGSIMNQMVDKFGFTMSRDDLKHHGRTLSFKEVVDHFEHSLYERDKLSLGGVYTYQIRINSSGGQ